LAGNDAGGRGKPTTNFAGADAQVKGPAGEIAFPGYVLCTGHARPANIMQIGVDSFVATANCGPTGDAGRVRELLEQIELADQVGLDVFGIGEHHRADYVSSAPAVMLAAAAARTKRIRLASAVTVLSSDDPVRVFQQFATVDLISEGRAEIIVGRGSFIESYPLFGLDLGDYDELATEKLDLLLRVRGDTHVHWSGKHRAALTGQGVYPRPVQDPLPVFVGVGGTPESVVRAATLGLPLIVAIIGGSPRQFRPLVDLYRETWRQAAHPAEQLFVGVHNIGFLADSAGEARETFWPAYRDAFGKIGRERGWPPPTRAQFDAQCDPAGALQVGDPAAVADKILREGEWLGGIDRLSILLDNRLLTHRQLMRAIELLGTQVAPLVRRETQAKTTPQSQAGTAAGAGPASKL
jgi:probable LLM family oxidoreductase